jgi:predicted transcriptional regulator
MTAKTRTIEVDEATACTLESLAAERGLSVAELVAGMVALESAPITLSPEDLDELDRPWAAIKSGEPTTPHEDVAKWLQTWGTPEFKPWRSR